MKLLKRGDIPVQKLEPGTKTFSQLIADPEYRGQLRINDPDLSAKIEQMERDLAQDRNRANGANNEAAFILFELVNWPAGDAEKYIREHPPCAWTVMFIAELAVSKARSENQRQNAMLKAAYYQPAKELVAIEWEKAEKTPRSYEGKSDFAKIIVGRIKNELNIDVKWETIAREWLPKKTNRK